MSIVPAATRNGNLLRSPRFARVGDAVERVPTDRKNLPRRERHTFVVQRVGLFEEIIVAVHVARDFPDINVQDFGRELADGMNIVGNENEPED
ncbi:MAG: hypothetical protein ABIQ35_11290 [Verrucomicrobiota bacterium]